MTADRTWMEKLGFELEDKGSMVPLWVVVDDCGGERPASLAEIVLWTSLTAPPAPAAPAEPMTWEQAVRKHINDTEYAERLLALPDDATAEQVHACAPRHHAPVAPALKYVDDPKQTGVGSWCAPGPAAEQKRMFVLRFEDQDRGEAHYTDEAEARAMFARAEARGWNCHLFVHVNRVTPVDPAEPTHLRRADGTLSGVFIEPVASGAATVAADLRNWLDFLPGHAQPTIEQAVRLLETRP